MSPSRPCSGLWIDLLLDVKNETYKPQAILSPPGGKLREERQSKESDQIIKVGSWKLEFTPTPTHSDTRTHIFIEAGSYLLNRCIAPWVDFTVRRLPTAAPSPSMADGEDSGNDAPAPSSQSNEE